MKKIIVFILITFSFSSQAQFRKNSLINLENFDKQRLHWGYFLGFNSYDFKFDYKMPGKDVLVGTSIGFNVGLVGNLRLNDYFNLRLEPGLFFNQRNIEFPGFDKQSDALRESKATYIHFPLLLKFSSERIGNIKPFLIGGVGTALNLSGNTDNSEDNKNAIFRTTKWTNFYEIGIGIDLYFEYFKFSPSVRGIFSLNDELIRDKDPNSPWTSNVQSMQTRGIFVNFTFH